MAKEVNFYDAKELVAVDFEVVGAEPASDGMVHVLFVDHDGRDQVATVYYNDSGVLEYFA